MVDAPKIGAPIREQAITPELAQLVEAVRIVN